MNRPKFANIVSSLSGSLEAMAGYLDLSAFGEETTVESNECREEGLELVEERLRCQASSANEEKCQDEAPLPDESTV